MVTAKFSVKTAALRLRQSQLACHLAQMLVGSKAIPGIAGNAFRAAAAGVRGHVRAREGVRAYLSLGRILGLSHVPAFG